MTDLLPCYLLLNIPLIRVEEGIDPGELNPGQAGTDRPLILVAPHANVVNVIIHDLLNLVH